MSVGRWTFAFARPTVPVPFVETWSVEPGLFDACFAVRLGPWRVTVTKWAA